jgi:hypothetical protein
MTKDTIIIAKRPSLCGWVLHPLWKTIQGEVLSRERLPIFFWAAYYPHMVCV